MRAGEYRILSRLGCLLIVVCLLAAPVCETRCTLSICPGLGAHEPLAAGCHHASKPSRGSSVLAAAIAPSCLPEDSLLTTLPAPQSRLLSADSDSRALAEIPTSPSPLVAPVLIAFYISNRALSRRFCSLRI